MTDYWVYILKSEKTGGYYTGISSAPDSRLYFHNQGMNTSTRSGIPWLRVWLSDRLSKTEALSLEKRIKKRGAARFLSDSTSGGHA